MREQQDLRWEMCEEVVYERIGCGLNNGNASIRCKEVGEGGENVLRR